MIFLKVNDETGNPGLVSLDKVLYFSSRALPGDNPSDIKCRIHLVGGVENYVDITNSFEDVLTRLTILLER